MAVVATRLAVLIDADNASARYAPDVLTEVATFGTPTIKRAYGDWTTTRLSAWKEMLHPHAIQPIQQFANTSGKNASDSALIIDAMDLLYAGNLEGFVIVSSDSDFTRLATRLRESGMTVYGIGRRDTPPAFVAACDEFVFLDLLGPQPEPEQPSDLRQLLEAAITSAAKDDGWSNLSAVGQLLRTSKPGFDPRDYGRPKLGELVREQKDYVEVKEVTLASGDVQLQVRLKPRSGRNR